MRVVHVHVPPDVHTGIRTCLGTGRWFSTVKSSGSEYYIHIACNDFRCRGPGILQDSCWTGSALHGSGGQFFFLSFSRKKGA